MRRLLAASALIAAIGCFDASVPEPGLLRREPTPLVPPFSSHQTVEQARAAVPDAEWTTFEDSRAPARGRCPRFDVYTISTGWRHLGDTGELRLHFVNGVLYRSVFSAGAPARLRAGALDETLPPRTRVRRWETQGGGGHVAWSDEAIEEEIDAWIRSCA